MPDVDDTDIPTTVEQLTEQVVLCEPGDLPALGELHTGLEAVAAWAHDAETSPFAGGVQATADLVERIVLDDVEDPTASLALVGEAVSTIRSVVTDGRTLGEAPFPQALQTGSEPAAEASAPQGSAGLSLSLPPAVDEKILSEFLTRQTSVLQEAETHILAIERSADEESLGKFRGLVHTLKGESALLGLKEVERICHLVEDTLTDKPPQRVADFLLAVKDWLAGAFSHYSGSGAAPRPLAELLEPFGSRINVPDDLRPTAADTPATDAQAAGGGEPPAPVPLEGDTALLQEFVSEATEHLDSVDAHLLTLESDPSDKEAIHAVFRAFHTIKGVAGFLNLHDVRELAHEAESLLDKVRKGAIHLSQASLDVSFDAVDVMKRLVHNVAQALAGDGMLVREPSMGPILGRLQDLLADREPLPAAPSASSLAPGGALSAPPPGETDAEPTGPVQAERTAAAGGVRLKESVKVDADRLDRMVDMIGELVICESMVSQSPEIRNSNGGNLTKTIGRLDKITRELQEIGTSLRMMPIRPTFQKMARLVRDLAKNAGKRVDFSMSGEDTELDKSVVDRIGDPLVHMVRNAVDHGIENSPQERENNGKPAAGQVELRAFHKGGNICIEIQDDGRGLDRDVILSKARERGVVKDGHSLNDQEVFQLIFEPGFSTAKQITEVSGRGVGMDVVKRNIDALRGNVEIRSKKGQGSVFTLRLPLTLAIIDGMVIRLGAERYILPTLSIVRSIRPKAEDLSSALEQGEMVKIHGHLIPLFRLSRLFAIAGAEEDPANAIVVVVEESNRCIGLLVDELLGQQQIVIKSLGAALRGTPGLAGGAIMADGRVGLILDVAGLVEMAHRTDESTPAHHPNRSSTEADEQRIHDGDTSIRTEVQADAAEETAHATVSTAREGENHV